MEYEPKGRPPRCALDSNGCLGLDRILSAFNAPLGEVQTWAVCYQTAKCIHKELEMNDSGDRVFLQISDLSHVRIHKEGHVHPSSFLTNAGYSEERRDVAHHEEQMIESLGAVIFGALDYGLCLDEQASISRPLELLIEKMTSSTDPKRRQHELSLSEHPDDELHGLVRAQQGINFSEIIDTCAAQLLSTVQAEAHYKAVCRALVAEVLELSSFLQKIVHGTEELRKSSLTSDETDSQLDNLLLQDWARLWVQVIRELRNGVKLKKVKFEDRHPYEFELTPYEMLLDDIRLRRYRLKKVMVNGDLPRRVKKDAHALILEFIKSRPPLVPASKRSLPPKPERPLGLYEKLMASIRQQHKLKPTKVDDAKNAQNLAETCPESKSAQPARRLIKVDPSLRLSLNYDDDDDDDDYPLKSTMDEPMSLPVFSSNNNNNKKESERRHSVSTERKSTKQTSPCCVYSENYWGCSQWRSLEFLSLTLEEVVHIRNVLTKAELESVIFNKALYEDLEKGKICFTCKNVRFSLFGAWGHKCKLCDRNVCVKCSNKMKIPTEHFAKIPVYMLSPVSSPPPTEPNSLPFWTRFSSDDSEDQNQSTKEDEEEPLEESSQPGSLDPVIQPSSKASSLKRGWSLKHSDSLREDKPKKRAPLMRSKTIQVKATSPVYDILDMVNGGQRLTGPLVSVCGDCKNLVRSIMESSREPKKLPSHKKNLKEERSLSSVDEGSPAPLQRTDY